MAQPIPCCLPKFGSDHSGPKRPASLRTRISGAQTRQLLSAWDQGQLDPLLQASWAILLHHYTGLEEICFGYQPSTSSSSSSSSIPSSAAHNDLNDLNHLIFNLSIAEDDSLQSVLRRAEYKHHGFGDGDAERCEIASPVHSGYTLFNTILMLRDCRKPTQDTRTLAMQPVLANPLPEEVNLVLHLFFIPPLQSVFNQTNPATVSPSAE